jgi:hypothetical protein
MGMEKLIMILKRRIIAVCCSLLCISALCFSMDLGRAWLEQGSATVNQMGDWTVHYEVGSMGIAVGGTLRIQFPHAWFVHPWGSPTVKDVQTGDADLPHYAYAKTNRQGARLEINIGKEGVDGQHDRWQKVFNITVKDQALMPGDRVTFTFAQTPVPLISETDEIMLAVDPGGNEIFIPLDKFPKFEIKPGNAEKLLVFLPSKGVVGEVLRLRVVALDAFNNRADSYREKVQLSCPTEDLDSAHVFSEAERGVYLSSIKFSRPGIHTVQVIDKELANGASFESNPIRVLDKEPELKLYWGDLHSHCGISKDGVGRAETAFLNAHDVFALDFYALTDHSVGDKIALNDWGEGITPQEWELTQSLVRTFNKPREFVTFLAYEWSSPAPYGHHNVFFKADGAPVFDLKHNRKIEELWAKLENWEAFTVPHHTAIMWRGINSPFVDWTHQNDRLRPAVEIYSLHGACEYFNNPMKYEDFDFTPTTSNFGPYYARDGWAAGNYVGTVAGSDNHTAHPGQPHGGLTCIMAPELTREALFDGIMKRHTYATTGARILLGFWINGRMMGERFALAEREPLQIKVEAVGTAPIEFVEVMRFGGKGWEVAHRVEPENEKRHLELSWIDEEREGKCIYYCRLKQKGKLYGRDVMAWSTPIWIDKP